MQQTCDDYFLRLDKMYIQNIYTYILYCILTRIVRMTLIPLLIGIAPTLWSKTTCSILSWSSSRLLCDFVNKNYLVLSHSLNYYKLYKFSHNSSQYQQQLKSLTYNTEFAYKVNSPFQLFRQSFFSHFLSVPVYLE